MGKTRFGALDLQVQARELRRRLVGSRVSNIYDLNGRTYVLKLNVPPARTQAHLAKKQAEAAVADGEHRAVADDNAAAAAAGGNERHNWGTVLLLVESGARIHTTNFIRDTGAVPSGFCLKLRKHIRTRRLDAVTQLGSDRVLALSFSAAGKPVCNLIVEFYAGGNLILTEPDWAILAMLRMLRRPKEMAGERPATDEPGAEGVQGGGGDTGGVLTVGDKFPVDGMRVEEKLTREAFDEGLAAALAISAARVPLEAGAVRATRRRRAQAGEARRALASVLSLGPQRVEHALVRAGFDIRAGLEEVVANGDAGKLFHGLLEVERMVREMPARGYRFGTTDVTPFRLAQYEGRECEEFDVFDDAVDAYFVELEVSREEAAKVKRSTAAFKKVNKLTAELRGQVTALEVAQDKGRQKAQAIESNVVDVEAAIAVVNSALAAAVDWDHLARMVEDERGNGNPIAETIHSLHLDRNEITLMLEDAWGDHEEVDDSGDEGESDGDSEADEERDASDDEGGADKKRKSRRMERSAATRKALLIDVNISLSAHANAREYYSAKKTAAMKMEKAVEATDRTIKAASKKAERNAHKMEEEAVASSIRARRTANWFEKFHWMISSENFLIVAGRDSQQNEQLVNRYMGPADAYVHADVDGASSVVVKNQKPSGAPEYVDIPQLTLEQAGSFAMCRSKAWEDKIVTSAWWVRASQVSKAAPSGLSLATGSFVIRGKKHFLDPSQLVMGFAFLFKVDESCAAKHRGERCVRGKGESSLPVPQLAETGDGEQAFAGSSDAVSGSHDAADVSDVGIVGVESLAQGGGDSNDLRDPTEKLASAELVATGEDVAEGANLEASPGTDGPENPGNTKSRALSSDVDDEALFAKFGAPSPSDLPDVGDEDETDVNFVDGEEAPAPALRTSNRRLSAKERRQLKNARRKVASGQDSPGGNAEPSASVAESEKAAAPKQKAEQPRSAPNVPLPRGKLNKLKRMKKKYGDQDEEERELALKVLGARKVKEELEDSSSAADETSGEPDSGCSNLDGKVSSEGSHPTEASAPRGREIRQQKKQVMRILDEEGILELAELEKESLKILDMLTAVPAPDDVVEYALPVCAPYSALVNYRYRAKLLPGNMKRGKAFKASLGLFLRQTEKDLRACSQERDAMRVAPESDAHQMMLGNVLVASAGILDLKGKGGKGSKGKGGGSGKRKK